MSLPPSQRPAQPVRTCVGCRQRAAKADLLRVVVDDRGAGREVVPDPRGRVAGRGAHLHPTPDCLQLAVRRRAFTRALRVEPGLSTVLVEEHVRELAAAGSTMQQPEQHDPSVTEKKLEQQLMSTR